MKQRQKGVFLLEALIAILIFSIGILTLVAMQTATIQAQTAAQYRIEAASLADKIVNTIWLSFTRDPTTGQVQTASLTPFEHQPGGTKCAFSGTASALPAVQDWVTAATYGTASALPGATAAMQQILVDTSAAPNYTRVTVTVCWKAPAETSPHSHTVVTYIGS
jgi:type IV pilus assembly protein PilV